MEQILRKILKWSLIYKQKIEYLNGSKWFVALSKNFNVFSCDGWITYSSRYSIVIRYIIPSSVGNAYPNNNVVLRHPRVFLLWNSFTPLIQTQQKKMVSQDKVIEYVRWYLWLTFFDLDFFANSNTIVILYRNTMIE